MSKKNQSEKVGPDGGADGLKAAPSVVRRWSSKRRMELVMQLLRGESLDSVSRKSGVALHQLSEWREKFLAGAETALKTRVEDFEDDSEKAALFAKIGEVTMANELLEAKIAKLENGIPFHLRR
jgi:transposase-like protein